LGAPPEFQSEEYHLDGCKGIIIYTLKNMKLKPGILLDIDLFAGTNEKGLILREASK